MAQQGPYFDPSQFDFNPEESLRDGRFSTGREIEMTAADDEEEDDYQASKRSSAGPVRKKGASKGRKKGASECRHLQVIPLLAFLNRTRRSREAPSQCLYSLSQLCLCE